jgi:hypothetical protein
MQKLCSEDGKEAGLELNTEETECMVVPHHKNIGQITIY